jgi:NADPH:quinone reductase-like Zn-dependent oxidoreductase
MKITVIRSAVIDAPIDRVWNVLRDFNSHGDWHPAVVSSEMENVIDGDMVGGVRRFSLAGGAELREQLLSHSDRDHSLSYCILDSPLPLFDYVATIRLRPVTDGNRTFWDWRSQFRAPEDSAAKLKNLVGRQIYEDGFRGLRMYLTDQTVPAGAPAPAMPEEPDDVIGGDELPARAVVVDTVGGPEVMSLTHLTVPGPQSGQVRIRQQAIAVNFLDLKQRRGTSAGFDLPGTPGLEGVGQVIDVGDQVNGFFPGDRVAYLNPKPGSYTDIRCVDADLCIPLPDSISDIDASNLLKGTTAALLLTRVFRAAPNSFILIESVAGGLGHLLCQWAKSMGLIVIGTASTTEKARFSRDRGCDYPLAAADYKTVASEIMRITNGRGVDFWVHSSGANGLEVAVNCMAPCGQCAVIGDRDGDAMAIDINLLRKRSLTVSAPVCFDYLKDRPYMHRLVHQLFTRIQSRTIIPVTEVLPLSQAAEAHLRIESRRNTGAVVLVPDDGG